MAPRDRDAGKETEGDRTMFIFNRSLLAVVAALLVPVLLVLLDGVINLGTI